MKDDGSQKRQSNLKINDPGKRRGGGGDIERTEPRPIVSLRLSASPLVFRRLHDNHDGDKLLERTV